MALFRYDQKDLIGQMEDESWEAAERSTCSHINQWNRNQEGGTRGRDQAVGWRNQREESGWQREEDVQASSPLPPLEALRLRDSNLQIFRSSLLHQRSASLC